MKPGILFSPGAFHPAACFDQAKQALEDTGIFHPILVTTHPSLGDHAAAKTALDDAEAIQTLLRPHIDADGRELILLAHSYGGFSEWAATDGWTVAERRAFTAAKGQQERRGGVQAVVLISSGSSRSRLCLLFFLPDFMFYTQLASPG